MRGGLETSLRSCAAALSFILHRRTCHSTTDALRTHSTSPSTSFTSPFESRLRTILRNEIQYQHDYAPPHQPVTEFDRFVVEDRPGQQWITLMGRSIGDENIKIEATMFDGSVLAPKSGDEGTEEVVQLHISMLVDIWRGDENHSMEFVCSAWPDSLEIQKVYMLNREDSPTQPYIGPDFKNLNNKLRTRFYDFLNVRGINSDLSKFLHKYMMNKDRIELIQWLRKVHLYLGK